MSLDGAMLHNISTEIMETAKDSRVERVMQPSREEFIIRLRTRDGRKNLLINLVAGNARLHFTEATPDNPQSPPMFCMLLRKHLSSAKLIRIDQYGLDRAIKIVFEGYNELGDKTNFSLIIEIMGKYSNLILIDGENKIIDAIKKIDFSSSTSRQILPGIPYSWPEKQDKLNILEAGTIELIGNITAKEQDLSKALLNVLEGFSPLPVNEISHRVADIDKAANQLSEQETQRLKSELESLKEGLENNKGTPTMVLEKEGRPKDFSFINISMFGELMEIKQFADYSSMLDFFYVNRDQFERMRQRSGNLLKLIKNSLARIQRRITVQTEEQKVSKNKDEHRTKGDILTANLYKLSKGQSKAVLENYYENNAPISIELDTRKSPSQNAQHYYSLYRKAEHAEKILAKQIKLGRQEEIYMESVLDALVRSETESDLEMIREELVENGYIKRVSLKKGAKVKESAPYEFTSSEGYRILVGRNNKQNDYLTLKYSDKQDIWLHTKDIPGSHVIIDTGGETPSEKTIEEAAIIAAYHSKGKESSKIRVDYTPVRFVKKPSGAKPGMVIYNEFKSIVVDPDVETVNMLKKE